MYENGEGTIHLFDGDQDPRRFEEIMSLTCDALAINLGDHAHQCAQLRAALQANVAKSPPPPRPQPPALCYRRRAVGGLKNIRGHTVGEVLHSVLMKPVGKSELGLDSSRANFLVLGDSHTRVWRLAAARTSSRFTVVEATGGSLLGILSYNSRSGTRSLFEDILCRSSVVERRCSLGQAGSAGRPQVPNGLAGEGGAMASAERADPAQATGSETDPEEDSGELEFSHLVVMLGEVDVGSAAYLHAARARASGNGTNTPTAPTSEAPEAWEAFEVDSLDVRSSLEVQLCGTSHVSQALHLFPASMLRFLTHCLH